MHRKPDQSPDDQNKTAPANDDKGASRAKSLGGAFHQAARRLTLGDERDSLRLRQAVQETDRWLSGLQDPELGPVGQQFRDEIKAAGCREGVHLKLSANAVFSSFVYPPRPGQKSFQNRISYGAVALENMGKLFGARVHEFIHGFQYKKAAAMHADPFNAASPYILSPIDYVLRKERLEQDAYAKGAWLQSLAKDRHADIEKALDATPIGVAEFERLRAAAPDLRKALADAALAASDCEGRWISADSRQPARDLWHKIALEEYARIIKARRAAGQQSFTFVRMDYADINEIGDSFGPNPFRGDNRFSTMPRLSAENRALLDALNHDLGLSIISGYTPIGDALDRQKQSRGDFIAASRGYRQPAQKVMAKIAKAFGLS